jgi:hypothetical protein
MEKDDLEVLLRSRIPVLAVESHDETEVLKALMRASMRLPVGVTQGDGVTPLMPGRGLALFQWTVTDGLKRLDLSNTTPIRTLTEPLDILKHIRATTVAGTYALLDFHPYLDDATHLRLLKDIALDFRARCVRRRIRRRRDRASGGRDPLHGTCERRSTRCGHARRRNRRHAASGGGHGREDRRVTRMGRWAYRISGLRPAVGQSEDVMDQVVHCLFISSIRRREQTLRRP